MTQTRSDHRADNQLRPTQLTPHYLEHAEGSVLIEAGRTRVICTASVEDKVPPFRRGSGKGWVTAEYGMLPRATSTRTVREASRGKLGGRTQEIQRLIGRSLRAILNLEKLTGWTLKLDCDVLQADGGTRTASVNGAYLASCIALRQAIDDGRLAEQPLVEAIGAVSVGIVGGETLLDLDYSEDSRASVDLNVVQTEGGRFLEVQGTAEGEPFSRDELDGLLDLAASGISEIIEKQAELINSID